MSFEDDEIGNETFVQTRRGMRLIGENNNPRYKWYVLVCGKKVKAIRLWSGVLTRWKKAPVLQDAGGVAELPKVHVRKFHIHRPAVLTFLQTEIL